MMVMLFRLIKGTISNITYLRKCVNEDMFCLILHG